jgi:hypothetical protein
VNYGASVLISWTLPDEHGAAILEYQVLIRAADLSFHEENTYCNGVDPSILEDQVCEVPLNVLRAVPYSLDYPQVVSVKVRARNVNGWSDYSPVNEQGAIILTEPVQMLAPWRGPMTSNT